MTNTELNQIARQAHMATNSRYANTRIKVVCLECGKKFQTTKTIPECPKCGGVDIDVRE